MRPGLRLAALLLCAAAALACNDALLDAPRTGAAPVLANPNLAVGVTVGEPVSSSAPCTAPRSAAP